MTVEVGRIYVSKSGEEAYIYDVCGSLSCAYVLKESKGYSIVASPKKFLEEYTLKPDKVVKDFVEMMDAQLRTAELDCRKAHFDTKYCKGWLGAIKTMIDHSEYKALKALIDNEAEPEKKRYELSKMWKVWSDYEDHFQWEGLWKTKEAALKATAMYPKRVAITPTDAVSFVEGEGLEEINKQLKEEEDE